MAPSVAPRAADFSPDGSTDNGASRQHWGESPLCQPHRLSSDRLCGLLEGSPPQRLMRQSGAGSHFIPKWGASGMVASSIGAAVAHQSSLCLLRSSPSLLPKAPKFSHLWVFAPSWQACSRAPNRPAPIPQPTSRPQVGPLGTGAGTWPPSRPRLLPRQWSEGSCSMSLPEGSLLWLLLGQCDLATGWVCIIALADWVKHTPSLTWAGLVPSFEGLKGRKRERGGEFALPNHPCWATCLSCPQLGLTPPPSGGSGLWDGKL